MRTNRSVRFSFCGATVLVDCCGDQVSFNTTAGVWYCPFKGLACWLSCDHIEMANMLNKYCTRSNKE